MRKNRFLILLLYCILLISTACGQVLPKPTQDNIRNLPGNTPTIVKAMNTWIPIPTPSSTTQPQIKYQLTYVSDGQDIYGINVSCLLDGTDCLWEKELLYLMQGKHGELAKPISANSWSIDGSKLAVCATGTGDRDDIFWTFLDQLNWTNITNTDYFECGPNWTPDGLRIIYEAKSYELYGGHIIFSTQINGQETIQLLSNERLGDEGQIKLSPDGNRLAFIHSDDNGFYQLYIADIDGSNRVQLTDLPAHNYAPSFSPDSQSIVFQRQTDPYSMTSSRNLIVILNLDTKEEKTIISGTDEYEDLSFPTWAPFDKWIAFMSDMNGNSDIYIIKTDGSNLTRVTSSTEFDAMPQWRVYPEP